MLAPPGSPWETAWGAWRGFFELKTGGGWEGRGEGRGRGKREGEGEGEGGEGGWFGYKVPRVGEPRGVGLEFWGKIPE